MENATEALKMAAAVLVFVLAMAISITAFGEARQTTQTILNYRDREYDYSYVENNGQTQRIVSAETIVPSIYKAYKENYKIVFRGLPQELYEKAGMDNSLMEKRTKVYSIDLEKEVLGSDEEKERFIRCLLYGEKYQAEIDKFKDSGIILKKENFYDTIKGKKFIETLGVYYQEEIQGGEANAPDANKTKKRVVTYTVVN